MADAIATKTTPLPCDEVITRAVQFFSGTKWRPTGQSARTATFEGRAPIPWFLLLLTVIGFLLCLVPGIIMYIVAIRKVRKFQNIVVSTAQAGSTTEVTVKYPPPAKGNVKQFLAALPASPDAPPLART